MKRPLRDRTMGAVREGRGDPSPYSIVDLKLRSCISGQRLPAKDCEPENRQRF